MLKQIDLRDVELYREYDLKVSGGTYTVQQPRTLYITDEGSHRVVDVYGMVHRIPHDEIGIIRWRPKDSSKEVIL